MNREKLGTGTFAFDAIIHRGRGALVLFAVGGGGDPRRHGGLLQAIAAEGHSVVAPVFERMISPRVSADFLVERGRVLRDAMESMAKPRQRVVGIGHSIGGATLLMTAGAKGWVGPGQRVEGIPRIELDGLLVMASPTAFFRGPGALDGLKLPVLALSGGQDRIVPSDAMQLLIQAPHTSVEVHDYPQADHFSFMDERPPHAPAVLADRGAFLAALQGLSLHFIEAITSI